MSARPLLVLVTSGLVSVSLVLPDAVLAAPAPTAGSTVEGPSPPPAEAPPQPPVQGPPPPGPVYPPGYDPYVEAHLAREWGFASELRNELEDDVMKQWYDFVEDEHKRAAERASGEDDDPPRSFDDHMYKRYRRKRNTGIIVFSTGFIPVLATGITSLAESDPWYMWFALLGVPFWAAGGAVWASRAVRLHEYVDARDTVLRRLHRGPTGNLGPRGRTARPRLEFRGLAPLVHPTLRTGGVSLGFAF